MKNSYLKPFFIKIFFLCFCLNLVSCKDNPSLKQTTARVIEQDDERDYERDYEDDYNRSCRNSDSSVISIRDSDYIDHNNVSNYRLRGRCDSHKQTVTLEVNGNKISDNPLCDKKYWQVSIDLSSLAPTNDFIFFQANHDGESACLEVRVAFSGPKNYVPVPSLSTHYKDSFFVMKYEAKLKNKGKSTAQAISEPEEKPVQVTYDDAVKLCQNNGSRYDLISNAQWQNIVLSIEETDKNWSNGRRNSSDNNSLNCGVTSGLSKAASTNDLDDCSARSCEQDWDFDRRTHFLSNGSTIWDICGNAGEIMKDKYTRSSDFSGPIYDLSSTLKKLFGPKGNYNKEVNTNRIRGNRNTNRGLGYAEIQSGKDLIVRGSVGRSNSGLFSVSIISDQTARRINRNVGFRCVYNP